MVSSKRDTIYVDVATDYVEFMCGKCDCHANLVRVGPGTPNESTDLKNITVLGFLAECPKCHEKGIFKINLMGTKRGSEE
jgi:hypothetical protein